VPSVPRSRTVIKSLWMLTFVVSIIIEYKLDVDFVHIQRDIRRADAEQSNERIVKEKG
jgi:hypothetical protein